jgi:hypothetical protein
VEEPAEGEVEVEVAEVAVTEEGLEIRNPHSQIRNLPKSRTTKLWRSISNTITAML